MGAPQNIIGIVYDYDQTLSPTYMQDEVIFPTFGIKASEFWKRCRELVDRDGFESELAYLKVMLDYLAFDRPSNADLQKLGVGLRFYKGLPEMFDELTTVLSPEHQAMGVKIEHYIVSSGIKTLIDSSTMPECTPTLNGSEFAED